MTHKSWDRKMKRLFRRAPEDIVQWLFPGAEFHEVVSPELDGETIYADHLYEVTLHGKRFLLHIEFQRNHDPYMAERLWEYNVRATLQYGCPVWSCVIYLKKGSTIEQAFLIRELPNGQSVHRFDFSIIRLWEVPTKELKERGLPGLLPLLALTREGAKREVVEDVIVVLTPPGEEPKADLLAITYVLASLAFEQEEDQEWLIRRFAMLDDIIRESRAYYEMTKESRAEGIEEGREEGKLVGLRDALVAVVQARFPNLKVVRLAKGQSSMINDPEVLQSLIAKISLAQTLDEVQQLLIDWPETNNKHD